MDAIFANLKAKTPDPLRSLPLPLKFELQQKPFGASYALLFNLLLKPFWPALPACAPFSTKMDPIAAAEDEDAFKNSPGDALKALPEILSAVKNLGNIVVAALPCIQGTSQPEMMMFYRAYESLRWHQTGEMARILIQFASTPPQQQAYAFGYACQTAASVTAEPFVNNITGGPYRLHWWRKRWVANFADAWAFGRYETAGARMIVGAYTVFVVAG